MDGFENTADGMNYVEIDDRSPFHALSVEGGGRKVAMQF